MRYFFCLKCGFVEIVSDSTSQVLHEHPDHAESYDNEMWYKQTIQYKLTEIHYHEVIAIQKRIKEFAQRTGRKTSKISTTQKSKLKKGKN